MDALPSLLVLLLGSALLGMGVLSYTGRRREWAASGRALFASGLACLHMGGALIVLAIAGFLLALVPPAVLRTLLLVTTVWGLVGVAGLVWWPRVLMPRWFRLQVEHERADRRAVRTSRRARRRHWWVTTRRRWVARLRGTP
ncbi:hypothetical protein [Cellulomonas oligotrophica]|uniref:Uncharacterized protein n=1 Tax=Cellulomonas oligotrophica TaxID=931536 RepID=A0A7Y9FGP8_9CELL|nr:hypothetical protein [Cellulomonas oligotrophica]NYD86712.1 hypothetical protein [Cellulomonas oligotrophica]GIG34573.1 hypothetical protein Col01nite_37320 [Cellulomonas oligotrophica]